VTTGAGGAASVTTGGGGATSVTTGAGGSTSVNGPAPFETVTTGPIQNLNAGGAASNGAAGAQDVGGAASTGGAGTGQLDSGAPSPPKHKLRDIPPGEPVVLDPDDVYALGPVTDVSTDFGGIAPLSDTQDAIVALNGPVVIRNTDGHVLYSLAVTNPNGSAQPERLYEFRRDDGVLQNITAGEAVLGDYAAACATVPSNPMFELNGTGSYVVAFDGPVYSTCGARYLTNGAVIKVIWLTSSDELLPPPPQESILRIAENGLVLSHAGLGNVYSVSDASTGAERGTVSMSGIFGDPTASGFAWATRARPDSFWIAGSGPENTLEAVNWVELDASAKIANTGSYAPLPAGVTIKADQWTRLVPVIDGKGALYQAAFDGDEPVIVRRPMSGSSSIAYRLSSYDSHNAHQVLPEGLVTGG
jgi:hypothetical protein